METYRSNTTRRRVLSLRLKSQYLFIFCGGLLAVFVVFIVLFMAGVNQWLCIGFIVSASLLLVWQTFRLNAKYGTHGLMKAAARKRHPRFIISRKAIPRLFTYKKERKKDHEKYVKGYHAGKEIPPLAVENGCIISKDADITVAFRVELPELFTVTSAEYEAIHSAWYKANQGAARLLHSTQAGLLHQGELPARHGKGRA